MPSRVEDRALLDHGPHSLRPVAQVGEHYDKIAPAYDVAARAFELLLRRHRRALWRDVQGGDVLEVGIGTGANVPFHPSGARVTGIDISPGMLDRARREAARRGVDVRLEVADVERLPFETGRFDVVVATFVFCAVPQPLRGLSEAARVLKPGGRVLLLEHVLPRRRWLAALVSAFQPLAGRVGEHLDRHTAATVGAAGFEDLRVTEHWLGLLQRISARNPGR